MKQLVIALCACAMLAAVAYADYVSDFEGLAAFPDGFPLTGQDNYYIPSGTTSVDYLVYTYPGNTLGLPMNPDGGLKFVGGTGPGSPTFARGQRDVTYSAALWELSYDFAAHFEGPGAANNVGSFSMQPAPNDFIHLMSWVDPSVPTTYQALYMAYDAAGTQFPQPGQGGGPAWESLMVDHWYRATAIVDFVSNQFTEIRIKDIMTGVESTFNPVDWYLEGGAGGSTADATAFRFFAGGGNEGNSLAFDNIVLRELAATAIEPTSWGAIKSSFK